MAARPPGRRTRRISARPRSRCARFRMPKATAAASNVSSGNGRRRASPDRRARTAAAFGPPGLLRAEAEHLRAEVGADHEPRPRTGAVRPAADGARQLEGEVGGAAAEVEDPLSGPWIEEPHGRPPPAPV